LPLSIALLFVSINYLIFFVDLAIAQEQVCYQCSDNTMAAHLKHMEMVDAVLQTCINDHCASPRFIKEVGEHISAIPVEQLNIYNETVGQAGILSGVQQHVIVHELPNLM